MRRGALVKLLVSPLTIFFAVFGLFPAVMAPFVLDAKSAGAVICFSFIMCAQVGGYLGERMMTARRSSFAWTLPRFRRELLREFVGCGVAVSTAGGLIPAAIATGATMPSLATGATGFAVFSLGGVLCLVPEAPPILLLTTMALLLAFGTSTPAALLDAPVAVITIALAISTVALWLGFRSRTFRWSSLDGLRGNVGLFSTQLQSLLWWPKRRPRPACAYPGDASRAPYVGTSVFRGIAYSYQAARLRWLFRTLVFGAFLFAAMTASFVWLNLFTGGPAAPPTLWFGLVMVGMMTALVGRGSSWRVALPWSRQQLLNVAYARDLVDTLWYLLPTSSAAIAVFFLIAHPDSQLMGALARAGAATALFFPVFQWPDGPPTGRRGLYQRQSMGVAVVVRPAVIIAGVAMCVYGLPVLVNSPAAQAIVLGLLLVASQILHWLNLRRYFTTCDLVGEAR
jgi:hypothetical protein